MTGCMGRGFPEHYVGGSEPSSKAQSRGYVGVSGVPVEGLKQGLWWSRYQGQVERLRRKGHLDGCTKDYTVVREEEDYCELDGD